MIMHVAMPSHTLTHLEATISSTSARAGLMQHVGLGLWFYLSCFYSHGLVRMFGSLVYTTKVSMNIIGMKINVMLH